MKGTLKYLCSRTAIAAVLTLLLTCTACQAPGPVQRATVSALPPAPDLPVHGSSHYVIDAGESVLLILVYRGGPLAEFGHNHVIAAGNIQGDVYLTPDIHDAGFLIRIPVRGFTVDPAGARRDEGKDFATQPSPQAIAGTRENMLGPKVLDSENYPEIRIRSLGLTGPAWAPDITARVTLHGVSRDLTIPVAMYHVNDRIVVTGTTYLLQSDFGMTPFSVMGGGLQVQDRVRVRFHFVAVKQ